MCGWQLSNAHASPAPGTFFLARMLARWAAHFYMFRAGQWNEARGPRPRIGNMRDGCNLLRQRRFRQARAWYLGGCETTFRSRTVNIQTADEDPGEQAWAGR